MRRSLVPTPCRALPLQPSPSNAFPLFPPLPATRKPSPTFRVHPGSSQLVPPSPTHPPPRRACLSLPSLLISFLLLERFWALSNLARPACPLHLPGLCSTCPSNSRSRGAGRISRLSVEGGGVGREAEGLPGESGPCSRPPPPPTPRAHLLGGAAGRGTALFKPVGPARASRSPVAEN